MHGTSEFNQSNSIYSFLDELGCDEILAALRLCELEETKYFALVNSGCTLSPKTDVS